MVNKYLGILQTSLIYQWPWIRYWFLHMFFGFSRRFRCLQHNLCRHELWLQRQCLVLVHKLEWPEFDEEASWSNLFEDIQVAIKFWSNLYPLGPSTFYSLHVLSSVARFFSKIRCRSWSLNQQPKWRTQPSATHQINVHLSSDKHPLSNNPLTKHHNSIIVFRRNHNKNLVKTIILSTAGWRRRSSRNTRKR